MEHLSRVLAALCLVASCLATPADIKGQLLRCNNEGMPIKLDSKFHCFSCICRNRSVECKQKVCPNSEDCLNPTTKPGDPCCPNICRGCWYNGTQHSSGSSWRHNAADPCLQLMCVNGVITESRSTCYTPCSSPLPPLPGQCCPRCPTCSLRGQSMGARTELRPSEDPCLTCVCDAHGSMTCSTSACPALACPPSKRIRQAGQCCQKCIHGREFAPFPGQSTALISPPSGICLMGNQVLNKQHETATTIDSCNRCRCLQGGSEPTVHCMATTCPPLIDCPLERQRQLKPTDCCKSCLPASELALAYTTSQCITKGVTYKDGDSWQLSPCASCQCDQGIIKCAHADCAVAAACPRNFHLTKLPGKCCPECIERDGRCMVFGGHFRTFDDRHLSFHGECKYQLAIDCSANHTFAVRMSSGPRSKLITVKLGRHKVTMGQRLKTKVDGVRVSVPHRLNKILEISMQRDNLLLTTSIGLKVVWNGQSLIEVSVPPSMKSRLCGLCGNYNGKAGDDMVNRQGETLHRAEEFAQAWRIGGAKSCPRGSDRGSSIPETCKTDAKKKNRDYRKCSPIRSELLGACNSVVSTARYYKACVSETCRCPPQQRCHCEVLEAYIRECTALASNLAPRLENSWRYITGCYQGLREQRGPHRSRP